MKHVVIGLAAFTGGACTLFGVVALLGSAFVGESSAEAAAAWFALGTLIAAAGAGYFAMKAAAETGRQRTYATTPAFVELTPSGPVPQDVVGLDKAKEPVEMAEGYCCADCSEPGFKMVKKEACHWVVTWNKVVVRRPNGKNCDHRWHEGPLKQILPTTVGDLIEDLYIEAGDSLKQILPTTVGDLRTVIVQRDENKIGVSVPLTNAGGGVAVIKDDSIALHPPQPDGLSIARCGQAVAVNRNRVPPGATVRLSAVLEGGSAQCCRHITLRFTFTDLHELEWRNVIVSVEIDPHGHSKRWFVTDITVEPARGKDRPAAHRR
jgi:hypothetical protein